MKMPFGHPSGQVVKTLEFPLQELDPWLGKFHMFGWCSKKKKRLIFKKALIKLRVLSQFGNLLLLSTLGNTNVFVYLLTVRQSVFDS